MCTVGAHDITYSAVLSHVYGYLLGRVEPCVRLVHGQERHIDENSADDEVVEYLIGCYSDHQSSPNIPW